MSRAQPMSKVSALAEASAVGLAKIFNEKAGYVRRKIRVHELISGSLSFKPCCKALREQWAK